MLASKHKLASALYAAAYFTGAEVFFRMTQSAVFWEQGKYAVIFFSLWGMLYLGFKRNSVPYIIYFLLLLPAITISLISLDFDANFRKSVLFNLSGPFCLSIASVFAYGRTLKFEKLLKILDYIVYPLIATVVYVILYTPDSEDLFRFSGSNRATSGGYGGNQVSTVLGLGFFILATRFFIPYKNFIVHWTMMLFMLLMGYRALLTFSRGGVVVAILATVVFLAVYYFRTSLTNKVKIQLRLAILGFGLVLMWGYSEAVTGGMIVNRYTNKNASGVEKEDITTGRGTLAKAEMDAFLQNPIFGTGAGGSKDFFEEDIGRSIATHNEVTRMLSEHGLLGLFAILTLMFSPFISILKGRKNIYFLAFILIWFLTLLHAAMRVAVPAFIYALCLLNVDYDYERKTTVRGKQTLPSRSISNGSRHIAPSIGEGGV